VRGKGEKATKKGEEGGGERTSCTGKQALLNATVIVQAIEVYL
jgi:hypothetical protein